MTIIISLIGTCLVLISLQLAILTYKVKRLIEDNRDGLIYETLNSLDFNLSRYLGRSNKCKNKKVKHHKHKVGQVRGIWFI